jgi:hypothetical protein
MFGLVVLMIRLTIAMCVLSLWLCWAMIAFPAMLIASACGNRQAARSFERSMRWHGLRF